MNPSSVLYIEDEEDYQILVKRILSKAGFDVRTADTGAAGLAALRERRPSLLLLDINLPDTDGYAICEQLRQDPSLHDLPVLMLTVRRRPEEWLRGFSVGANDYLSKPFDPSGLLERVRNGLSGLTLQLARTATPEFQLIQAAAGGNRAAFEVLIQKYKDRLTEGVRQMARNPDEADDVVSHAFVCAFEKLQEFRGEASFYTWLYRIALNEAMAVKRQSNNYSLDGLTTRQDEEFTPELAVDEKLFDTLAHTEHRERVRHLVKQIPELYREVLELYFFEDLAYDEIAKRLEIPIGTVMSRLFKARQLLLAGWKASSAVVS